MGMPPPTKTTTTGAATTHKLSTHILSIYNVSQSQIFAKKAWLIISLCSPRILFSVKFFHTLSQQYLYCVSGQILFHFEEPVTYIHYQETCFKLSYGTTSALTIVCLCSVSFFKCSSNIKPLLFWKQIYNAKNSHADYGCLGNIFGKSDSPIIS